MNKKWIKFVYACVALCIVEPVASTPCADDEGPRGVVEAYITAMSQFRFNDAWEFVSENMTDSRGRDEWVGLQNMFYKGGEVTIFGMDIRQAHAIDDDPACEKSARVPNILKSRDKFNTQGTTEFEYYITIKDGEVWKVDSQETLFTEEAIREWFPDDEIPVFRDAY
ncbi:MAG: hypothetical protein O7G83_19115 [Proteobacteria bacterium]|nr:hypothetical protein [Pseudomonadota bacterium]